MTKEEIIRRYYSGWENQDWDAIASVLARGFIFASPTGPCGEQFGTRARSGQPII